MKIGIIVDNMSVSGGYQKNILLLSKELVKLGHDVKIYTLKIDREKCFPELINDFNIFAPKIIEKTEPKTVLERFTNVITGPFSARKIYEKMASIMDKDLDFIMLNNDQNVCLVCKYKELSKKKPTILWFLNCDMISFITSKLTEKLVPPKGKSFLFRMTRFILSSPSITLEYLKLQRDLKSIDIFATYDEHNRQAVKKYFEREAHNILACVDVDSFDVEDSKKTPFSKKEHLFFSIGIMYPYRRHEDFLRASAELIKNGEKIKCVIIGKTDFSPEYFQYLKNLSDELGIKNYVDFISYIDENALKNLRKMADGFVFVNDGFTWGQSVFEAVAARIPVVVTKNIGAAELIKNKETGFVVNPKSPSEISEAMFTIINDSKLCRSITNKAYDEILPLLTPEAYTKRLLGLIK